MISYMKKFYKVVEVDNEKCGFTSTWDELIELDDTISIKTKDGLIGKVPLSKLSSYYGLTKKSMFIQTLDDCHYKVTFI